jgi:hypothetical protein
MPDAVCVRVFPSRAEAQLAREILEDIDIPSRLLVEDEPGAPRTTTGAAAYKLMVSPRDVSRARSVLRGATRV